MLSLYQPEDAADLIAGAQCGGRRDNATTSVHENDAMSQGFATTRMGRVAMTSRSRNL